MDDQDLTDTVEVEAESESSTIQKKKGKPGIIYLSSVPDFMSVQKLRQTFEEYGDIHRTFFQPVEKSYNYKKGLLFTEGWVEFRKKSIAKLVAANLNNSPVGGKKRHPWYNCIWTIKYLPKFLWTDVNADKELKRQTHDSRIRTEISQAKKQTSFYAANLERGQSLTKMNNKRQMQGQEKSSKQLVDVRQRLTDEEVVARKRRQREQKGDRVDKKKLKIIQENEQKHKFVMSSIFGGAS